MPIFYVSRAIFFFILKVFFRMRVTGRENIPKKGGFILASNHLSYIDPAVVGSACPRRVSFMAREDLFSNFFLGWWMRSVGVIPIKRNAPDYGAFREAMRSIKKGLCVAIFPEGTRSPDGSIGKAQPGIGFLAVKFEVPVIPVFIKGTERVLPKAKKVMRLAKLSVRYGSPVKIDKDMPYQDAADLIMAQIRQLA